MRTIQIMRNSLTVHDKEKTVALSPTALAEVALIALAAGAWLLVLLARVGWFRMAPIALLPVALALAAALLAVWRASIFTKFAAALLAVVAALLYLPPAQQLPMSGDAAIYPNEGAWLARTGALRGEHPALAALSPETADLFYISSEEQIVWGEPVSAYEGLIYGGYYLTDADTATIQNSRMPQVIAWHGLVNLLFDDTILRFVVSLCFAAGSILVLFATGLRLYGGWIALWAALLLALCYPQIYLARGSLAESTGAFWTLAGFWFAVLWLQRRAPRHLLLALLMWVTSWSARVDALLLLAPAALLVAIAAGYRDRSALRWAAYGAPLWIALILLGSNNAYFLATIQLATTGVALLTPALVALIAGAPLTIWVVWRWGEDLADAWQRVERPLLAALWLVVVAVLLWATVPGPWRDAAVTRPFQEIIWFSSLYISPLFYWFAAVGLGVLFWRGLTPLSLLLSASFLGFAVAYLHGYTSANVYPVSLRRLSGDLLPLMALIAGYTFTLAELLPPTRLAAWRKPVAYFAGVASLLWVGALSAPLLSQHEHPDDQRFIQTLHEAFPADAALLFEPQDGDSWIGWLAAPLFSLYGDWALLLESDTPDPALLARAIDELRAAGRTPLIVSQSTPLPAALLPAGMEAREVYVTTWNSALLGQARPPDEPVYWQFALPLHVYGLTVASSQ